ncbi:MAG: hypothetical protein ACK5KU_02920 [Beutenbergiaceae bacterium]
MTDSPQDASDDIDSEAASEQSPSRDAAIRDVIAVVLLSVMAVLTAWCGFESSKWGGAMSIEFSSASSSRIQAAVYEGQARDQRQHDLTIYASWIEASATGNEELADYIEGRFSPAFQPAFTAWREGGMSQESPFLLPEYVAPGATEAADLTEQAQSHFAQALVNNQRGDQYSLLTVLFALVLFLTAMAQRRARTWVSWTYLSAGLVAGATGTIILLNLPVLI